MTTEEAIVKVEAAGFYWAVEGGPGRGDFLAYVDRMGDYVGDGLSYPGAKSGATIAEALLKAVDSQIQYEAKSK